MALLDIQRRGQQIGRIRIGQLVPTGKANQDGSAKMRPAALDTFRFTTGSQASADAIAELYGGEVREWRKEFEVVTDRSAINVMVPPRDQVVTQNYEMWSGGGCQRRCDSQREQISGGPCLCPHADNPDDAEAVAGAALERSELAKLNPPQACKPITRINLMIPDLPGLGVFRLDTSGYYAATEIGDAASILQMARDQGVFLPAVLRIDRRERIAGGQTKKYPVPVLEPLNTFRQIATGQLGQGGIAAQLPPAPGEPVHAITSGAAPSAPAPDAGTGEADNPIADDDDEKQRLAQRIADEAAAAGPRRLRELKTEAVSGEVGDRFVCTDREHDGWEELLPYLQGIWDAKSAPRRAAS